MSIFYVLSSPISASLPLRTLRLSSGGLSLSISESPCPGEEDSSIDEASRILIPSGCRFRGAGPKRKERANRHGMCTEGAEEKPVCAFYVSATELASRKGGTREGETLVNA